MTNSLGVGKEVKIFNIIGVVGENTALEAYSIEDLRCQIAPTFGSWAHCILLLDGHTVVVDSEWEHYITQNDPITITAINDTLLVEEMFTWTIEHWDVKIEDFLRSNYWSIIDALEHIKPCEKSRKLNKVLPKICTHGCTEMVIKILTSAAEIERRVMERSLMNACRHGHIAIVSILLDHGVESKIALECASEHGKEDIVCVVLDRDNYFNGEKSLELASMNGHKNIVEILLDRGTDINSISAGKSLECASRNGFLDIVLILLNRGVDATGKHGEVALEFAWMHSHQDIVLLLLDHVKDIGGHCGGGALIHAALDNQKDIASQLLGKGVDVGGDYTQRAMEIAISRNHKDVFNIILDAGYNTTSPAASELLKRAMNCKKEEIAQMLINRGVVSEL